MRKIFFVLCAVLLSTGTLFAETISSVKIGDLYYKLYLHQNIYVNGVGYVDSTYAYVTTNPNQYAGKVTIPSKVVYNDISCSVIGIYSNAFKSCSNLTAVTISEGVKEIGSSAFQNCSSLGSVDFPNTLTTISSEAFRGCSGLISIVLPNSVTSLGSSVFRDCSNLKTVQLSTSLTSIPYYAFYQCHLDSIELPEGITNIGEQAFYNNYALKSIVLPSSVTTINNYAFDGCSALKTVKISDLNAWCKISFGDAYANPCYKGAHLYLNEEEIKDLVIPDEFTGIKAYAFYGCQYIKSLTLPEGLTAIGASAFSQCSGLTSVVLPNSMENIANNAFGYCTGLVSLTIGTNVANIHQSAFTSCSKLSSILWNAKDFTDFGNATLSPFYDKRNQITSFTFGENVEHIPAYLCYEMNNLQKIDIPANVQSVGQGAFAFCGRLNAINAAAGSPIYTSVDGVLYNKDQTTLIIYPAGKSATTFTVPSTVTKIEDNAFFGCNNLSMVEIPASVAEIGEGNSVIPMWSFLSDTPAAITEGAFASDVYLIVDDVEAYKAAWPAYASRIFPRAYAVKSLELAAKADKSALHMAIGDANLESVVKLTIKGSINSYDLMIMRNKMINLRELDLTDANIEANPYEYYTGISSHADTLLAHSFRYIVSLKLPKSLKYVSNAVQDCDKLKYLEINGGVVGTNMAAASTGYEVVLNEGVTEIKADAFKGKTGLKKISMYGPITKIYANSFQGCTGLQEVILPATLETIEDYAFNGSGLLSITIPANLKSIGTSAFSPNYNTLYNIYSYYYSYNSNEIQYGTIRQDYASSLARVQFEPNSQLRIIGKDAFYACPIDTLIMPDSVRTIGNYAFCNCRKLRCVSFSDESKLTSIGTGVFQQCASLDSLRLPASLKSIGTLAFSIHTDKVTTSNAAFDLILPEALETIGKGAFYGRTKMSKVAFPNTLKSIARDAFRKCEGLPNLSFPTSLQTIGDYAFEGCKGLEEIKVPSTLLSVGDYAFSDCSDVTKVYTYTVEPVSINQNTFSCWHNADLYVPTTSYYTYYYNTQWSQFLSLKQFDEEYSYFYINNDYELGDGTGTIEGNPDADLNENSGLIVTGDSVQGMGTITIMGDGVNAGSIIACEDNLDADSLAIRIVTQKGKWNYFCFPFDLLLDQFHYAYQYVIREYDGATRAQYGAGGWINLVGDMIQKGLGYIFQGAQTDTLVITIKNPKISCEDFQQTVLAHESDNVIHSNWNFIGNPYPSWYDLDALFEWGFSSAVYIWDGVDYHAYMPGDDEYHFHPYEGFFTQNPSNEDMTIIWGSDGRETKSQADNKHGQNHAPRKAAREMRQAAQERKMINLQLASDSYTDQTRIVFNDAAKLSYEIGRDAVKMDGGSAPLHLWSIAESNRLSINERPYGDGQISLGYDAQEAGAYTLSATRMDTAVVIYDNELKQEVDLSLGDYVFFTEAGTNETRFSIIRVKDENKETTGLDGVQEDGAQPLKQILDGQLYIKQGVQRFDMTGKKVE